MSERDFGKERKAHDLGGSAPVVLECRYVAPGLTLHHLVQIFEEAKRQAKPGDELAANPSKWPEVRGVKAVTSAIVDAFQNRPAPPQESSNEAK